MYMHIENNMQMMQLKRDGEETKGNTKNKTFKKFPSLPAIRYPLFF